MFGDNLMDLMNAGGQYPMAIEDLSDDEKEDGFKYVFVTRVSKDSVGEKMRSAMGLWSRKELYIDNDLNQVFARLKQYYGS